MIARHLFRFCLLPWLLSLSFLVIFGCSEEQKNNQVANTVRKAPPPAKKVPSVQIQEKDEEIVKKFIYSPTGRRDPFEPLIKKGDVNNRSDVPLTPLQRFDLGQFRLQAVLIGKGAPRAMVSAPDGKTYILSPGIKIGKREGVVTQITREAVQIEEIYYDVLGVASRKQATIALPEQKKF